VLLERQQDGALDADLLGIGRRQPVEGVLGVRPERAEPSRQVRLAVLEASQVGGEAGEVSASGAVVALGLGLQRAGLALRQSWPEDFLMVGHGEFSSDGEPSVS
jgi:hypothetical protein